MSKPSKPESKVIQISELYINNKPSLTVLCEDGSIWNYGCTSEGRFEWTCILEAPVKGEWKEVKNVK